ncbi:JAB domain-containing protein [Daejeonella oryzae]|uniref:JAB domain-containing protein n=1 Tax=Daejeonella oryzae TaxID=1122943 RepID=UPI000427649E|nr:JAB domain-containing protein [Daejeonella oryzae]
MEKQQNQISLFQVSEINVVYKPKFKASERPAITSSKNVYEILIQSWDMNKIELLEQFKILLLNRANKVLGIFEVSSGGISGTTADPKLIFGIALKTCASGIIISHNHPSGQLKPSDADLRITRKIKEGGNFLDISVLDHVIITSTGYFSFADEGLI